MGGVLWVLCVLWQQARDWLREPSGGMVPQQIRHCTCQPGVIGPCCFGRVYVMPARRAPATFPMPPAKGVQ